MSSAPAPRQLQLPVSLGQDVRSLLRARCSSGQGDEGPHAPGEGEGTTTPAGSSDGAQPEEKESDVQAAIADILNMEIRKAKVKEEILADLEIKKEKLRLIGQEITDDFGKEIELDKMRTELASNMSLADTMSKFQELEDEVQAVRDQLAADRQSLADWEEETAAKRSKSLFFKTLYATKKDAPPSGTSSSGDGADGGEDCEGVSEGSPGRRGAAAPDLPDLPPTPTLFYTLLYLFAWVVVVLVADVTSADPSPGQDALYVLLCVGLAYCSIQEWRKLKDGAEEGKAGGP
ncbi:hypothetical protein FOA52_013646 [Chlamydomonas sp. UWO 241]|nr:hypothetical protein FOA52_013646 [Chlamydomonas sp. UWO 241]